LRGLPDTRTLQKEKKIHKANSRMSARHRENGVA
jgi:hypothetical protein